VLECKNISLKYNEDNIIENVSFKLMPGSILGILGKNGVGKSTLMHGIYGLITLSQGVVLLNGKKVLGPNDTLIPGDPNMRLVSQSAEVRNFTTIEDNIASCFRGKSDEYIEDRIHEVIKICGLEAQRFLKPESISGGQKQRLALARALAEMPDLLLLDEPFSQVDSLGRYDILNRLKNYTEKSGLSIIIITHHVKTMFHFADNIIVLEDKKILQSGTPETLYKNPNSNSVANLTGLYSILNSKILRPENIQLHKGDQLATVTSCHFNGSNYLISLVDGITPLFAYSNEPIPQKKEVRYKVSTSF